MTDVLCSIADIGTEGKEIVLEHQGKRWYLALFSQDGQVYCYHNVCPHQGRNLNFAPDQFFFDDQGKLICPHHGALFDVKSGECLQGPCRGSSLRNIPVRLQEGRILLRSLEDLSK